MIFVLFLIALPMAEVLVFIEVGLAIGWLWALVLLVGTSMLGVQLLRIQGRAAIERVSLAVSERRAPGAAALDGALGFVGGLLLVVPGFISDAFGVLLLAAPTRALTRRWISRHYAGRVMRFVAATGRFGPGGRMRPADVDSTAVEDDQGWLGR
ncbi:MAG TPA: FxsA family protein [Solirubrobacteraceae bacterium]|nr:FxsA family protein [Solirubrobacteraceae bacterium]